MSGFLSIQPMRTSVFPHDSKTKRIDIFELGLLGGLTILVFLATFLTTAAILFLLGFSLSNLAFIPACLATVLYNWYGIRIRVSKNYILISCFLFFGLAVIALAATLVNSKVLDVSNDGQTYHTLGIVSIRNGWNPILDDPLPTERNHHFIYVNNYPKGPWILEASIYDLSNHIEAAKAFNLYLLAACFLITFSALQAIHPFSSIHAIFLSLLIALNPVSVCQLFSFYVDGQLASLITILLGLFILWYKNQSWLFLLAICAAIILLINIKLTGLVYAILLSAGMGGYLLLVRRKKHLFMTLLIGLSAGVALVGYNPYITNLARYGNPFYPAINLSNPAQVIAWEDVPKNLIRKNRVEKLLTSLFSASQLGREATRYKIPFTISAGEIQSFGFPDVRVAGFGPLFGGVLLLSVLGLVLTWLWNFPGRIIAIGSSVLILVSVLANPESWWARYAPQLFLIPTIVILLILTGSKHTWMRLYGWSIAITLAFNILLVSGSYIYQQNKSTSLLKYQLYTLQTLQHKIMVVDFSGFEMNRVRFDHLGLHYREMENIESYCLKPKTIYFSDTKICP